MAPKRKHVLAAVAAVWLVAACTTVLTQGGPEVADITSSADGAALTTMRAHALGREVASVADLEALVDSAWGNGGLGLHRGHRQIEAVLEAFLGIDHDAMHVLMEDGGMNLAATCAHLGLEPANLIATLTASYRFHIDDAVAQGIIGTREADEWEAKVRAAFTRRVNWQG